MAKSNETQNGATLPLFRVTYNFADVNGNLRSGTYVLPAENAVLAKAQAETKCSERFTAGTYRIINAKPF